MKLNNRTLSLAMLGGLFVVGCGGGGTGGTSTGPAQTANVGPVAVSFTGHPQAVITASSNQITAVGQAGASYTSLSMNPAHNLASTYLAFSRSYDGGYAAGYTVPANGIGGQTQFIHATPCLDQTFSTSGVVGFMGFVLGSGWFFQTCLSDGSQLKSGLADPSAVILYPALSPNGATFAYVNLGRIYTVPAGGGTPTEIYSGGAAEYGPIVWSPSGATLAFTAGVGSYEVVETVPAAGGSATNITAPAFANGTLIPYSWSPDGTTLACTYEAGSSNTTVLMSIAYSNVALTLTPTGYSDHYPTISPDGSKVAFYRDNTGGAIPGIYESDYLGANPVMILPDNSTTGITGPVESLAWSPFQAGQIFAGAHGTITGSPVDGFLVSQNASVFASLMTFTTTTPSTATLTQSGTNVGGAPIAFILGGDSITNISYTNVYSGAHQSLTLTSTPTALVTIDAVTGFVDLVAPAIAGKAHPALARSTGNALTYTGSFSAIYDGTGENLAPNGATSIELDRTTGKLVSFR